jgi:hypothetical protein
VDHKKLCWLMGHLFILIKRKVKQGEISFLLSDGRRARLTIVIEERPGLFLCADNEPSLRSRDSRRP